jgi:hypothetical protein
VPVIVDPRTRPGRQRHSPSTGFAPERWRRRGQGGLALVAANADPRAAIVVLRNRRVASQFCEQAAAAED